jgi:hypothetical protein
MNEAQLHRSIKIGMVCMGLIPVVQLCHLAYWGRNLAQQGVNLWEIISDPPASPFVASPIFSISVAIGLIVWISILLFRRSTGVVHLSICQIVLLMLAVHLSWVAIQTAELTTMISFIHHPKEQKSQNATPEGIRQSTNGAPDSRR